MSKSNYHISYITASHLDLFWMGHMFSCLDRGTAVNKQYIDDCLEHPERTYFIETTIFGAEFARHYPDYKDALEKLIGEGRLEIGAPFIDRFENSVSGESLIRNAVIGKRMLREIFGYDSEVCMHPDLPGYALQLPQIYSKAGIKYYLTSRKIFPNGQVFRFRAPDGSTTIHCHFIYGYGFVPLHEVVEKIDDIATGFPAGRMIAAGGGADLVGRDTFPGKYGMQLEDHIEEARKKYPFLEFSYANLKELMSEYDSMEILEKSGEVPSNWGSIASANVRVWDTNRAAEGKLLDAELWAAVAKKFLGVSPIFDDRGDWFGWRYDTTAGFWQPPHVIERGSEFEELWKLVLVPQDHNDASREGSESTFQKLQMHKRAMEYSDIIMRNSLERVARQIKCSEMGRPIVVFNQASWDRSDILSLAELDDNSHLVNDQGDEVPTQVGMDGVHFLAQDVPAVGFRTLYVRDGNQKTEQQKNWHETDQQIVVDNGCLCVKFDKSTGCISEIEYGCNGRKIVDSEHPGWGDIRSYTESRRDVDPLIDESIPVECATIESVSVSSSGPLYTEVLVKGSICESMLEQRWKVYSGLPRIDLDIKLLWWGKPKQQIRAAFPVSPVLGHITYETPFFANRWPEVMDGSGPWIGDEMNRQEWERHREVISWVDLSGEDCGVTISSRHAHYYVDNTNLQAVLLRSAVNCGDERRITTNAGHNSWAFSFNFHSGDWKTGEAFRRGFEFTRSLVAVETDPNPSGKLPECHSFVQLEPSNLMITAIKMPDRGDDGDMVVRFCETEGKACTAVLTVADGVRCAFETNLLEEEQDELAITGNIVTANVAPYEIRTWRLQGGH